MLLKTLSGIRVHFSSTAHLIKYTHLPLRAFFVEANNFVDSKGKYLVFCSVRGKGNVVEISYYCGKNLLNTSFLLGLDNLAEPLIIFPVALIEKIVYNHKWALVSNNFVRKKYA